MNLILNNYNYIVILIIFVLWDYACISFVVIIRKVYI